MIAIVEAVNYTAIPNFVPSGVLWFAEDTGDLWIGTGSSEPPKVLQIAGSGGSPGGFNGDLQYNNNGSLGGSAATTDAEGDITVPGFLSVASTLFDQTGSAGQTGQFLQTTVNGVLWATASGSGGSPGGSSGDIQFNSGSSFGGSTATITSTGSITIPVNSDLFWGNDTQISRISGGTLSIGVGAHGDETGSLILNNIHLGAGLYDGTGNIGSNNNLLGSTGSKIAWTSAPSVASITSTTATITNAFITTAMISLIDADESYRTSEQTRSFALDLDAPDMDRSSRINLRRWTYVAPGTRSKNRRRRRAQGFPVDYLRAPATDSHNR